MSIRVTTRGQPRVGEDESWQRFRVWEGASSLGESPANLLQRLPIVWVRHPVDCYGTWVNPQTGAQTRRPCCLRFVGLGLQTKVLGTHSSQMTSVLLIRGRVYGVLRPYSPGAE